ncbi:MAG: thermonuclease family protein [Candidatus Gracilibacteria bacterium]
MKNTSLLFIFWISLFLFFVFALFALLERGAVMIGNNTMEASLLSTLTESGSVVSRVVDGDTIEVVTNNVKEKIRLIGINAPESVDPRKGVECFGKEASAMMKSMIEGKRVELREDMTQENKDRYGRLLRYVYLNDTLVNLEMIQKGYAYEYTYNIPYVHQAEFRDAQKIAIQKAEGLWASATCAGKK